MAQQPISHITITYDIGPDVDGQGAQRWEYRWDVRDGDNVQIEFTWDDLDDSFLRALADRPDMPIPVKEFVLRLRHPTPGFGDGQYMKTIVKPAIPLPVETVDG